MVSRRKPRSTVKWTSDRGEQCSGQGRIVNVTDEAVRFEIATGPEHPPVRHRLAPGELGLVAKGFTIRPRVLDMYCGDAAEPPTRPSVIETLTGGAVLPVEDPRAVEFMKARSEQ